MTAEGRHAAAFRRLQNVKMLFFRYISGSWIAISSRKSRLLDVVKRDKNQRVQDKV